MFTEKFVAASLRKLEGPVYYNDIENALRDEFLDNTFQTPHFVSQGTGREQFVDDAKRLDSLRAKLAASLDEERDKVPSVPSVADRPLRTIDILRSAEIGFANEKIAQDFISRLFDKLKTKASTDLFADLFATEAVEHPDFKEATTRSFIIQVLSNEKRPDNFVTASITREQRRHDPFNLVRLAGLFTDPDEAVSHYNLSLNCKLDRAQLKIILTPKFVSLKRFILVVSCAPSLELCYVMEMLTEHALRDWGTFDYSGAELVRRWYKMKWIDPCDSLVDKIFDKLRGAVQESVDAIAQALSVAERK